MTIDKAIWPIIRRRLDILNAAIQIGDLRVPPGNRLETLKGDQMLLEEFLKPLNMTQVEAAEKMGISLNRLNELIRGKRGVTADTALRLATLLKTSPEFWMNLQSAFDLYHARRERAHA